MEEQIEYKMANDLRIGHHIVVHDGPCIILSITTSKTGKHGSAKAHITARNIFTDKKIEIMYSTSEMVKCPVVVKNQYQVIDIESDGNVSLLDENNEQIYNMVQLDQNEISEKVEQMFNEGKSVIVSVITAMNMSKIFDCSEEKQK